MNDDGLIDVASVSIRQGVEAWIQTGPEQIVTVSPQVAEQGSSVRGNVRAQAGGVCALPERTGEKGNKVFKLVPNPRDPEGKPFPEYIIGTRDVVQIAVHTGLEKTTYEEVVSGDGTLYIPDISGEPILAADKTPTELRESIIDILGASLKKPHAEVVVGKFDSKFSTVSGEIRVTIRGDTGPGKYPLRGMIRVLDFINEHGGPTDEADLTRVLMIAPDGTQRYLNLQKAIEEGDAGENLVVDHEDFIHLAKKGRTVRKFYALGEVTRPGVYPLQGGERVLDGMSLAGGPTRRTLERGLYIIRGDAESPEVRPVDLVALVKRGDFSQNVQLRDGDILYAPQRFITKLHDLIEDISPLLGAISTYEDTIVSLDNLGWSDVWHKVGNTQRSRITVTAR